MTTLLGSFHQGHNQYPGAGRQCTCNSLAAMIHAEEKEPEQWTVHDMNLILKTGSEMFKSIKHDEANHLLINDLPDEIGGYKMETLQVYSGTLERKASEHPFMNLEDSSKNLDMYCFLTIKCYTMAVFKSENRFYLYDPHSRNSMGMSCPDGVSALTKHKDLMNLCLFVRHLADSIISNPEQRIFEITHVTLSNVNNDFEGFSDMSDGECACRLHIIEEDLQAKIEQINQQDVSDTVSSISDDDDDDDQNQNQKSDSVSDDHHHSPEDYSTDSIPCEIFYATKLDLSTTVQSEFIQIPEKNEPELNDSFLEKVILDGLLNESNISIDMLADSDDDVPLSVLRQRNNPASVSKSVEHTDFETEAGVECQSECTDILTSSFSNECHQSECRNIEKSSLVNNNDENQNAYITDDHIKRGRKRLKNIDTWKRNMVKRQRNNGKSYDSLICTNIKRSERVMKRGCGVSCRSKCHNAISEQERQKVFHAFWGLGDINRQRDYITNMVRIQPTKMKTNLKYSSRKCSRKWFFRIDRKYVPVCKTFFLQTLDISHTMVDTALKKSKFNADRISGVCSPDKRGKHTTRVNKINATVVSIVKEHINSFPKVDSHYCRKDTNKSYLDQGLSVPKMYDLYLEYMNSHHQGALPVSIYTYRYIFDTQFNIAFHRPIKDRCDMCSRYQNASVSQKYEMQIEYEKHIENKNLSCEMKNFDKSRAHGNDELCVACFDLQQVLPTPHSNESVMYYTQKLCTFNLSVYDLASKDGYCYVWHECMSGRGANEIATCIYKFLQTMYMKRKKEVILYSDNCGGQNRNRHFLAMLSYAKKKFNFNKLQQKFLERGHTQNENDSIHASIEHKSKNLSIYTTPQWAATIRMARSINPYKVVELASCDFLDFKGISEYVPNFDFDFDGKKITWLKIKVITIEENDTNIIRFDYNDQTSAYLNLACRVNLTRSAKQKHLAYQLLKNCIKLSPYQSFLRQSTNLLFICVEQI